MTSEPLGEAGAQREPPFSLAGKYVGVRRAFGVVAVAMAALVLSMGSVGVVQVLSATAFVSACVLLWSRLWEIGMFSWYTGLGLAFVVSGLAEQRLFGIIAGGVLAGLAFAALLYSIYTKLRRVEPDTNV